MSRTMLTILRAELLQERIRVVNPDVCVPGAAIGFDGIVRPHEAALFELAQHDDDPAALHHAERRRLAEDPLVRETELFAVEVRRGDDVIDDEIRRDRPVGVMVRHAAMMSRESRPSLVGGRQWELHRPGNLPTTHAFALAPARSNIDPVQARGEGCERVRADDPCRQA